MNTTTSKSAGILLGVVLLAMAAYGLWFAWSQGVIGHNPRAPVASAMEAAVQLQASRTDQSRLRRNRCLPINIQSPKPEIFGRPGMALRATPTSFDITLLVKTQFHNQSLRDEQLNQLDYLTKQGLLAVSDVTIDTDGGPRPARNYRMTWAGYAASLQRNASSLCLSIGQPEYAGIEQIVPRTERMLDHEIYTVTFRTRVKDIPAWANTPEAKQLFPKLAALTDDKLTSVVVLRTQDGWRAPWELQQELASAAKLEQTRSRAVLPTDRKTPPLPTLAKTEQILNDWTGHDQVSSTKQIACLPLRLARSSKDRSNNHYRGNPSSKEFVVTYFDREGLKSYEYAKVARNLHILYALEQAGLASREILVTEQPTVPTQGNGAVTAESPSAAQTPAGIRYRIPAAFMDLLSIRQYGGGCIPAGRLNMQFISIDQEFGRVMVREKAALSEAPPWTDKVAEHLPALKALRDRGVAINISLKYLKRAGEAEEPWHVVQFSPLYPEIAYSDIPQALQSFLPKTVTSSPNATIRAPISSIPKAIPPKVVTLDPQVSGAGFPRDSYQAITVVQPEQPPYPAQGAPVHVISVYQGAAYGKSQGNSQSNRPHTMYPVRVAVSKPNALLILLSYEPVDWQIHTSKNAQPKQVLVFGYYNSRVTFLDGQKAPTSIARTGDLYKKWKISLSQSPTKNTGETRIDIAQLSKKLTGATPSSFQAEYQAPAKGFRIDKQTGQFVLPVPKKPTTNAPLATLYSPNRGNVGNRLIRLSYGAFNDAWSNHAYSAGKVYFEGTIDIHGSAAAHAFANIGMCLSRGDDKSAGLQGAVLAMAHGRSYRVKDGDVFGVAADLDQHQMYAHINGKWLTGQPGSGSGRPLAAGKLYRACVFASGSPGKTAHPAYTTWEVNFGAKPFAMKPPADYGPL